MGNAGERRRESGGVWDQELSAHVGLRVVARGGERGLTGSFIALVRRSDSSADRSIFFSSLCIACENRPSSLSSENMPGSTASADMLPLVSVDIQGAAAGGKGQVQGGRWELERQWYEIRGTGAFGYGSWLVFCKGHGGHAEAPRRGVGRGAG